MKINLIKCTNKYKVMQKINGIIKIMKINLLKFGKIFKVMRKTNLVE